LDIRPTLVDAALLKSKDRTKYKLDSGVRDFIVAKYREMTVFTNRQADEIVDKTVAFLKELGAVIPALAELDQVLRDRVVRENLYVLIADNLRAALGITGEVCLDMIRENTGVHDRCLGDPAKYLTAVEDDRITRYTVRTEVILAEVLTEIAERWEASDVSKLISMAAPESRLDRLDRVPISCWSELAAQYHFRATARNAWSYSGAIGSIDQNLAGLLVRAESFDDDGEDEDVKISVAIAVLNAADTIPNASQRIRLVVSLRLQDYLLPSEIKPEVGDLFTLLVMHDLIEDSYESFMHFRSAGWATIEPAIANSTNFVEFMTPVLVSDFCVDFLSSEVVPQEARDKVVDDLAQYLPANEPAALAAAGRYALARRRPLPLAQVCRVAVATRDTDLTLRLLTAASPLPAAPELVVVLAELGEPYSYLMNRAKLEFEVPANGEHRVVFGHLKKAGLVSEFKKRRMQDFYIVQLS
jgi:hypothetical protein